MRKILSVVIPGRRAAANPESITTDQEYGFRVRAGACHRAGLWPDPVGAPRNDGGEV